MDNHSTCCPRLDRSGDPMAIASQPLSSGRLRPGAGGSSELAGSRQREYGFLLFVEKPLNIYMSNSLPRFARRERAHHFTP